MPRYTEKLESTTLEVIPLYGIVAFPSIPISFDIPGGVFADICQNAHKEGRAVFFSYQFDPNPDAPLSERIARVGVSAKIKQLIKLPENSIRVIIEGISRASVVEFDDSGKNLRASLLCKTVEVDENGGVKGEALMLELREVLDEFVKYLPKFSPELQIAIKQLRSPGLTSDFVACNLLVRVEDKQRVLEEFDPLRRVELLSMLISSELEIVQTENKINARVRERMDKNQRDFYLREQLKAIQSELNEDGFSDTGDEELDEYFDKIEKAVLPKEISERLIKEVHKLAKTPYASAESSVIRSYLDTCLEVPWSKLSRSKASVENARRILDRDHDGLEKVKERILEFIAVRELTPEIKNQIICLVGPPGTGKSSVAKSIASSLQRKYVRVSLGGIRDEADIRGHRKTYIGSMPGRIITALCQAGVRNPVILLDEIDKMTRDAHGDPSSALLEVLDSDQNKAFRDHFLELPIDLSECVFIATANTLETVSRPLIDRMEVIELKSYSRSEKLSIAQNHLIPKQLKRHGLNKRMLKITDEAVMAVIDYYTSESGVRNLEREIGSLCRKAAKEIVENQNPDVNKRIVIKADNLEKYLGPHKLIPERISAEDEIGVVNGMAYTEVGGDLLKIECAVMPGTGKVELTGSLGDVMKESAHAAITYIRSHHAELGVDPDFYKTKDIHIHVPEGAVPKDGPSAGVTITTALVSELTQTPVRRDVAMTGEITLRGRVLAIGGLKEKTAAAYSAGVRTILIPAENERDLVDIDQTVRENVKFIPCRTAADVLAAALSRPVSLPVSDATTRAASDSSAPITMPSDGIKTDGGSAHTAL